MQLYTSYFKSPVGILKILANDENILELKFLGKKALMKDATRKEPKHIQDCKLQLGEYFEGKRQRFDLPLFVEGTNFQKKVWKELTKIGYGNVKSYGEVANLIGSPKASRAVGGANNKNRLPIIIPCHRVLGSNGKLVGFAGGMDVKKWLLRHEGYLSY